MHRPPPEGYALDVALTDVVLEVRRDGKEYVLKRVPLRMLREPEALAAFDRERRVLELLDGHGAPKLVDAGEDRHGPYLVMERVALPSWAKGCDEPAVAPAFQTLAEIHARGIVHRDVAPSNVLADASGARLVDFGLASIGSVHSTHFVGTLAYTAPEQARGEPVDASADVFAMALTALDAVAHVARQAPSRAAMLALAAEGDPRLLLDRAKPLLSRAMLDCLTPCLDPDPRGRPSAREVFP